MRKHPCASYLIRRSGPELRRVVPNMTPVPGWITAYHLGISPKFDYSI
jgi:hypothetical protein